MDNRWNSTLSFAFPCIFNPSGTGSPRGHTPCPSKPETWGATGARRSSGCLIVAIGDACPCPDFACMTELQRAVACVGRRRIPGSPHDAVGLKQRIAGLTKDMRRESKTSSSKGLFSHIRIRFCFWGLCALHFLTAVFYKEFFGVTTLSDPLRKTFDVFWQILPTALLRYDALSSIWNLHSQPPLFNIYAALLVRFFYPFHIQVMHWSNIILGSFISGMIFIIIYAATENIRLSLFTGIVLALNPSLFLYEAYILYPLFTAFWIVFSIFILALHRFNEKVIYILVFVGSLNILIMTRSVYHPIIFLVAVPIACIISGKAWKRVFIVSIALCLLSVGWYMKNYFKYGFFAGSSWMGMNLWNVASEDYSDAELHQLVNTGIIDPMVVDIKAFSLPSAYKKYGFTAISDITALSMDNFHNINIPDISRVYLDSTLRLIRYDYSHYLRNIAKGYLIFSMPSSRYIQLIDNLQKIYIHEAIYAIIFQGTGAVMYLSLPISILLYILLFIIIFHKSNVNLITIIRNDDVILFSMYMIIYTTCVCCFTDFGAESSV